MSAKAVPIRFATGEGGATSELVICRNIFYNCEHTVLLKDGGAVLMQNNTTVHLVTNVFARTANPPDGQLTVNELAGDGHIRADHSGHVARAGCIRRCPFTVQRLTGTYRGA